MLWAYTSLLLAVVVPITGLKRFHLKQQVVVLEEVPVKRNEEPQRAIDQPAQVAPAQTNQIAPLANAVQFPLLRQLAYPIPYQVRRLVNY